MDTFVTVYETYNSGEANIIKGHLESEGITCILQNELANQMRYPGPFNTGIKIQVLQSQIPQTIEILREAGYIKDEDDKPSPIIERLDAFTGKIPIINKFVFGIRVSILVALIVTIIAFIGIYISLPSTRDLIVNNHWCADDVSYSGKSYQMGHDPKANWITLSIGGKNLCDEPINFLKDGFVFLPGFNSRQIECKWKLDGKKMQISNADTFQFVYNGIYTIDVSENSLILKSPNTTIKCSSENLINF